MRHLRRSHLTLLLVVCALASSACRSTPLGAEAGVGMPAEVELAEISAALRSDVDRTYARTPRLPATVDLGLPGRPDRREHWLVGGPSASAPTAEPTRYGAHGHPTSTQGASGRLFPLLGDKVRARGHDLPLPVGISIGGFYQDRGFEITKLDVALGGTPIDVSSVVVEPSSVSTANTIKADLWVLPFLQVYGFYGKIDTNTVTTVTIPDPRPGNRPDISFQLPTQLDGDTLGGGLNLAGGYKNFWAAINSNYSRTDLGLDSDIDANVNSLRLGYHHTVGKFEVSAWIGGVYWNLEKEVSGTIQVPDVGTIEFDVRYAPVEPINLLAGTHITFDKHFEIVLEYGFWDNVETITVQSGFRF